MNSFFNARILAAKALERVIREKAYSNLVLDGLLQEHALPSKDRALCTELLYGSLRWFGPIQSSLERASERTKKMDPAIFYHLVVAAYQLQYLSETIPAYAAVDEAIKAIKRKRPYLASFANAVLRNLGSPLYKLLAANADMQAIAEAYGIPDELANTVQRNLDRSQWHAALSAFNQRPKMWVASYDVRADNSTQAHPFVPNMFHSSRPLADILQKKSYVQDPASQIAALLVNAQKGERILDLCAAPGGKSIAMAQASHLQADITAVDINENRLDILKQNAKRLDVKLETICCDGLEILQEYPQYQEAFDKVLLDAPCSGLGTICRHPELRLSVSIEKIKNLGLLQGKLLKAAAECLRPGGMLIYSVCSPLKQEGSALIADFLKDNQDFSLIPAQRILPYLPQNALLEQGSVTTWPHLHQCDAFYAACLQKHNK